MATFGMFWPKKLFATVYCRKQKASWWFQPIWNLSQIGGWKKICETTTQKGMFLCLCVSQGLQPFFHLHWVKLRCSLARVRLDKGGVLQPNARNKIMHGHGSTFHHNQYGSTNVITTLWHLTYKFGVLQLAPHRKVPDRIMYVQHSLGIL